MKRTEEDVAAEEISFSSINFVINIKGIAKDRTAKTKTDSLKGTAIKHLIIT